MEKLPKEFKEKWLAALRSGEYKQGPSNLYNAKDDSYCCMGIAGIVCGVSKEAMNEKAYFHSVPNDTRIAPPESLPEQLDAKISSVYLFARMNDSEGKTFSEIADYIESNL